MVENFRQVEIDCDCGSHLSATIIVNDVLDLRCSKCGRHFTECDGKIWGIKDQTVTMWVIPEKKGE